MPDLALDTDATVVVTGVNGLVGSHVADQLLKRGYNVRGVVRDAEKHKYLVEYFGEKHRYAKFELVGVPDMTVEGCYDDVVKGTSLSTMLLSSRTKLASRIRYWRVRPGRVAYGHHPRR